MLIIEPYNATHLVLIVVLPVLLFLVAGSLLNSRNTDFRRKAFLWICCINAVLYFVYKAVQANDPSYGFELLANLPLHFCNINLILLPLAILTNNRVLKAYQVYFGVPLAALALLTVDPAFRSKSLIEFTCLFYFYYHSMLMVIPLLMVRFKQFKPAFNAIWQPTVLLLALTAVMHGVNIVFRTTGIAQTANYFFTYGLEGDFLTETLKAIIPYNFFFLLPSLVLFVPYILVITIPYHLNDHRKKKAC